MTTVSVIGAGKWGQALALALGEKNRVVLASRTPRDLPGFVSFEEALASEWLVMTIPSQVIAAWLTENFTFQGQKILVAAKGIEASTGRFLNEIYEAHVPPEHLSFLSGPSFAAEVIQRLPTALVISSVDETQSEAWGRLFPDFIKIYTSSDVIGAEVAGAYKNVLAIASGISDGLGLGNNARAALVTRGLAEMSRFGIHFGAKLQTFMGLSGVGDLFLTATSTLSRNYRVGLQLALGKSIEEILAELGEVAEGVPTAHAIVALARKEGLYTPIADQVDKILRGGDVKATIRELLARRALREF
ncbi:MAG: NAD(P)H-dependent glycerol-3-phosphate dehydrogenase [Campylobacterales bacterium]